MDFLQFLSKIIDDFSQLLLLNFQCFVVNNALNLLKFTLPHFSLKACNH